MAKQTIYDFKVIHKATGPQSKYPRTRKAAEKELARLREHFGTEYEVVLMQSVNDA